MPVCGCSSGQSQRRGQECPATDSRDRLAAPEDGERQWRRDNRSRCAGDGAGTEEPESDVEDHVTSEAFTEGAGDEHRRGHREHVDVG
ncbi:hypothetical protein RSA46_24465, partial [Pseudomonas oryzihabitans]